MKAYYNENDSFAAQWLRNLIIAGLIAPGEVDERSISDILPSELAGYAQCHFFAGIGGWSVALRLAGWPDNRPVWTGSCPCQPFSNAGQGGGTSDERHLWPHWFHLIRSVRPEIIFGEQVEAAIGHGWLDLVQDDLEGEEYTIAPVGIPAAGVSAPHIRQRLWFVAEPNRRQRDGVTVVRRDERNGPDAGWSESGGITSPRRIFVGLDNNNNKRQQELKSAAIPGEQGITCERGNEGRMGVTDSDGPQSGSSTTATTRHGRTDESTSWSDCDWLYCRDEKWRPVESGTFPLANGIPCRVGRLRGYGNAIVPQVAAEVIRAYMECRPC